MNLADHTTFGVTALCDTFIEVSTTAELRAALNDYPTARILGGGSNVLVANDIPGAVIKICLMGIAEEDGLVTVGAGETWHDVVSWAVDRDLGGLENLALIPGTVGAAPMQNIGAYGMEQEECFVHLEALDKTSGDIVKFTRSECEFGYRTSIFKTSHRDKYVITSVSYQLTTTANRLNISYKDVAIGLAQRQAPLTIRDVFEVVVAVRKAKLPDPAEIGNAGSFFKNPVLKSEAASKLMAAHPGIPCYQQDGGEVKFPAAWLIDQAGWKGFRDGDVGVHANQALVLVNYAAATGKQVLDLSVKVQTSVREKFGVTLEREVNVW